MVVVDTRYMTLCWRWIRGIGRHVDGRYEVLGVMLMVDMTYKTLWRS